MNLLITIILFISGYQVGYRCAELVGKREHRTLVQEKHYILVTMWWLVIWGACLFVGPYLIGDPDAQP